jgi:predicted nucleotidyltransferase
MKEINDILSEIEKAKKIRILFACETGSRAWGFPSPDSDFDVRFIYAHHRDWYLSLNARKDTIEKMEGDLDVTGWDLKKSLLLLRKSNASLIERFTSPIRYLEETNFADEFRDLITQYYSPLAVFFHHYSLALKFWDNIRDKDTYKLKSLFYLLRSLLSCRWTLADSSVLPMQIESLMKYADVGIAERIKELIHLKAGVGEAYLHPKDSFIDDWIRSTFIYLEKSKETLKPGITNMNSLDTYFLKKLKDHDDYRTS